MVNIDKRELTRDIKKALNERYCLPEWCFLTEVPNATGMQHFRSMDGFAFNLYPSKNYQKIAFEIKTIRSDLVKELKDGSKSDEIAKFCDNFYLVIPKDLSMDNLEIPNSWGILTYNNGKLRQSKKAEKIENKYPLDDAITAGILQSLIRKHTEEYLAKEQEIKKDIFESFDRKVEVKVKEIKENISQDKRNKIEFDKFMEITKKHPVFHNMSSKMIFETLVEGLVLNRIKSQMKFSIDMLLPLRKEIDGIEKEIEIKMGDIEK